MLSVSFQKILFPFFTLFYFASSYQFQFRLSRRTGADCSIIVLSPVPTVFQKNQKVPAANPAEKPKAYSL
jgi:hypothetical protein